MIYVTSDTHYGHDNIVKYCHRPVMTPEEILRNKHGEKFKISAETRERHHDLLVNGINSTVGKDDTLWILGDATRHQEAREFHGRIHCRDVRLVRGNHDNCLDEGLYSQVHDLIGLWLGEHYVVFCHYPMQSWHKNHRGSWQLFGHVHGNWVPPSDSLQLDVGVDTHYFRPWSLTEIVSYMTVRRPAWEEKQRRLKASPNYQDWKGDGHG